MKSQKATCTPHRFTCHYTRLPKHPPPRIKCTFTAVIENTTGTRPITVKMELATRALLGYGGKNSPVSRWKSSIYIQPHIYAAFRRENTIVEKCSWRRCAAVAKNRSACYMPAKLASDDIDARERESSKVAVKGGHTRTHARERANNLIRNERENIRYNIYIYIYIYIRHWFSARARWRALAVARGYIYHIYVRIQLQYGHTSIYMYAERVGSVVALFGEYFTRAGTRCQLPVVFARTLHAAVYFIRVEVEMVTPSPL